WFSDYFFEYRMDSFSISSSIGDNDLSANKYSIGTTQTTKIGEKKKEALAGTLRFVMNEAKGKEKTYQRLETGVTYAKPIWNSASWTSSLTYYLLNYQNSTLSRKDNNVTLSTALAKPIKEWLTWSVVGNYTNNSSTESSSYSYDRYSIMTTATFNTAF
ncbi:hypothetical protein GW916_00120, partial [bacterium]|nr:hypothetical protein [bacterium]